MSTKEPGRIAIKHWEGDLIYEIREAKYKAVGGRLVIQLCGAKPNPGHPMEGVRSSKPLMSLPESGLTKIRQSVIDENVAMSQATWCCLAA